MGLRCTVLGHAWSDPEIEREREERETEVVTTVREYKECERCGSRTVLSENVEVAPRADADGAATHRTAGEDTEVGSHVGAGDDRDGGERPTTGTAGGDRTADETDSGSPGRSDRRKDDHEQPGSDLPGSERDDGAVILDDGETDDDRDYGEWPEPETPEPEEADPGPWPEPEDLPDDHDLSTGESERTTIDVTDASGESPSETDELDDDGTDRPTVDYSPESGEDSRGSGEDSRGSGEDSRGSGEASGDSAEAGNGSAETGRGSVDGEASGGSDDGPITPAAGEEDDVEILDAGDGKGDRTNGTGGEADGDTVVADDGAEVTTGGSRERSGTSPSPAGNGSSGAPRRADVGDSGDDVAGTVDPAEALSRAAEADEDGPSEPAVEVEVDVDVFCPNCGFVHEGPTPSLRGGDNCPECYVAYLVEREE